MSGTTGIRHNDGNVAEIGAMTNRWLDANFGRNTDDNEGADATVAEGNVEGRTFER
jgi:hypothetical protein